MRAHRRSHGLQSRTQAFVLRDRKLNGPRGTDEHFPASQIDTGNPAASFSNHALTFGPMQY